MHRYLILLMLGMLSVNAAAVTGTATPLNQTIEEQPEDTTVFAEESILQFPAARRSDTVAQYKNTTLEEYASWQLADHGQRAVQSRLTDTVPDLPDDSIRTGQTADSIKVTFIRNRSTEQVSFQDVVNATPASVTGTVTINGHTVNTSIPVNVTAIEASTVEWSPADAKQDGVARAYGSFGGENSTQYTTSLTVTETVPGQHTGNRVSNVSVRYNNITLTGHIEVPTPCHSLQPVYEKRNQTLHLTVTAVAGDELCTQQIAMKTYQLSVQSTAPFTLDIDHGNTSVQTIQTTQNDSHRTPTEQTNPIQTFLTVLTQLLPV